MDYDNPSLGSVDWKWAHLASDHLPGKNSIGFYLGTNVHWQLTQNNITTGAQLITIGNTDVSNWEYGAVQASLEQFLRDDNGPNERLLVFRNPPNKNANNPLQRENPPPISYAQPRSDYVANAEEHQHHNYYNKYEATNPSSRSGNRNKYDPYRRDDDVDNHSKYNANIGGGSIRSLPMGRGRGRGRGRSLPVVRPRGRGRGMMRRQGRGRGGAHIPSGYNSYQRDNGANYGGYDNEYNPPYNNSEPYSRGHGVSHPPHMRPQSGMQHMDAHGGGGGRGRHKSISRGRARGRGRGRGRGFIRQLAGQNAPPSDASSIKSEEYRAGRSLSANPQNEVTIQPILQQLSYPKKERYKAKDVVWVQSNDNRWNLCLVKYVLNDNELIVRPFGRSEMNELKITTQQIHEVPNLKHFSVNELKKCLESMKTEFYNIYNIQRNDERDLFEGSLVKCKGTFGEVLTKNTSGRYTVRTKPECQWYSGPDVIQQISRHQIEHADRSQMECDILRDQTRFIKVDKTGNREFLSKNEDEMEVYHFLGIVADFYINDFLEFGFTKMCIVAQLQPQDLERMNVKLGHIRYITGKVKEYNAAQKKRLEQEEQKNKSQDKDDLKDEQKVDRSYQDFPSSNDEEVAVHHRKKAAVAVGISNPNDEETGYEVDAEETDANPEDNATQMNIKLVIYGFDETITSQQCTEQKQQQMTEQQLLKIFGGHQRLQRLKTHFDILQSNNIDLAIVSRGDIYEIQQKLDNIGLFETYFINSVIIGKQSNEMQSAKGSKAKCISNTWKARLNEKEIIFVDSDKSDIGDASEMKLCKTVLIESNNGMNEKDMQYIEDMLMSVVGNEDDINHDAISEKDIDQEKHKDNVHDEMKNVKNAEGYDEAQNNNND